MCLSSAGKRFIHPSPVVERAHTCANVGGYVAAVRPLGFAAGGTANSFLEIAEGPRSAPRDPAHEQRAAQSGVRIRQGGRGCGDESRERLIASADDGRDGRRERLRERQAVVREEGREKEMQLLDRERSLRRGRRRRASEVRGEPGELTWAPGAAAAGRVAKPRAE